jgi:hypothetical protein
MLNSGAAHDGRLERTAAGISVDAGDGVTIG